MDDLIDQILWQPFTYSVASRVRVTTFARELEETHRAIRYTYDEWIVQLFGRSPSAGQFETLSNRVSNLIWRIATRNLALGTDVILDKGFWYQRDRENVRQAAAAIGAESKLYFLDAPIDVLRKRVLNHRKATRTHFGLTTKHLQNSSIALSHRAMMRISCLSGPGRSG